jgi:ribosomal protein L29
MASHYKQIKGIKYSRPLLDKADELIAGQDDGRISLSGTEELINMLGNDGKYTDLEQRSVEYMKENYNFTENADSHLRTIIASWSSNVETDVVADESKSETNQVDSFTLDSLSDEELVHLELQLDRDIVEMRFAKQMGTLKETHRFKQMRRQIARFRTEQIRRERELGLSKNSIRNAHRLSFVAKVSEVVSSGSFASELNEQMEG